ncbi:hypothetical protein F511_40059 [Dorcoceras hygrometricum]|uniref:Uncharacterized protein n=1 Tax=Dorcoceras hygrometricum TaxID=472368 RepID=A0A2Z7BSR3_9LAMI|nr:hypothetical protein F511_40059 [Dorcoceras hygrometricum]
MDLIDDLPLPTVKSQSPCDSGWSQAPVASKITPRETPYEWFIVLFFFVLNVSRRYFKTSVAPPGDGIRIRHRYSNIYVAKNKSITAEEATYEMPMERVVKKATAKRKPAPAVDPIAKRKRTTVGRDAPERRI